MEQAEAPVLKPTPAEIREQLRLMLASPAFHGSRRGQQFLAYVVDRSLAGESSELKERAIAVDVFGRDASRDLGEDTIVRVSAREVRKRLAQYYVSPDGSAAPIRIDLPPGSYAPDFKLQSVPAPPVIVGDSPLEIQIVEAPLKPVPFWRRASPKFTVAGLASLVLIAVVAIWMQSRSLPPAEAAFRKFWDPVIQSPQPLSLVMANPLVYHPSKRAIQLNEQFQPADQETVGQRPINVPPEKLDGSDLVPVINQYVGVGDMVAATEVIGALARYNKSARIRLSSATEFGDLRRTPVLLIGGVTNRWTVELQKNWRFQFQRTPAVKTMLVDTLSKAPNIRQWNIPSMPDGSAHEDYILLSRIPNSLTGGFMVVTAGLKQFGTEAGGRLLADGHQLEPVLAKLPSGWERQNLQVILRVRIVGNAPAQPEVVIWHLW